MHTDLRISLCATAVAEPTKSTHQRLSRQSFSLCNPARTPRGIPIRLAALRVVVFGFHFTFYLSPFLSLCVCVRKAARAFHHRHNLNSNINNLKWFVFFPSCCQLRRLRFTCFPYFPYLPFPSLPAVPAAGCLLYTSLQMPLLPLVAAAAAEGTLRCRLSAFFT